MLQTPDSEMTYLAGLYRMESRRDFSYPVFTILTRAPGESIRFIHDRMPLILPKSAVGAWLSPQSDPDSVLRQALTDPAFEKTI